MSLIFAIQLTAIGAAALALLVLAAAIYAILDPAPPHPFRWAAREHEARSPARRLTYIWPSPRFAEQPSAVLLP